MNERIKTIRKNANLTQTEFGEKIGATRAMIASYEGGAVVPADTVLKLISKEFGISYAWLKTGEGPMDDPILDDDLSERLAAKYRSLPDRLQMLVDALIEMDPEWYKTLDEALAEIERRHKERDAE
ncbi:MAG: helix-turn-helix transcriptional regulator [Clostridia bacterium]|jgi:transcriptional regulator with XRE-family HTH domain|nr:helix-turn-helix transcriptional regulator [Clostridia bacterium]